MNSTRFERLEDAIQHDCFPDVDLALRRGRHIDRSDEAWFTFLSDAAEHLDPFYRRFDCELVHKSDGYYYLLPTGEKLGRRQLSVAEMLVGQALTLLYLDTASLEHGGVVTREQLIGQLAGTLGSDALIKLLNPKRRRYDERVAEETVRTKIAEAVRRLSTLGFADVLDDGGIRLRPALLRFAEPVRGSAAPEAALTRLLEKGELSYVEEDENGEQLGRNEADEEPHDGDSEGADELASAPDEDRNSGGLEPAPSEFREAEIGAEASPPHHFGISDRTRSSHGTGFDDFDDFGTEPSLPEPDFEDGHAETSAVQSALAETPGTDPFGSKESEAEPPSAGPPSAEPPSAEPLSSGSLELYELGDDDYPSGGAPTDFDELAEPPSARPEELHDARPEDAELAREPSEASKAEPTFAVSEAPTELSAAELPVALTENWDDIGEPPDLPFTPRDAQESSFDPGLSSRTGSAAQPSTSRESSTEPEEDGS